MLKMQKQLHFVLLIDDYQTYFEWVGLFPSLEAIFEVSFHDELSTEGYKTFTQDFLQ